MILKVPFSCVIKLHVLQKHYSGSVTLCPEKANPRSFYFLMLNPYGGTEAEFSIFEDEQMSVPFLEAVGMPTQGYNPRTGLPITAYDFSLEYNDPRTGLALVLASIISEGIYQAEILYHQNGDDDKPEQVLSYPFRHYWQQEFGPETHRIAESFLASFGLS